MKKLLLITLLSVLAGCETAYYNTMEKVGKHKREILVDRIEAARESQQEGQEQFKDALQQFKSVIQVDGGNLEKQYDKLNAEYEDSIAASEEIKERIEKVESVSAALFKEWEKELSQYTSATLKADSAQKLKDTKAQYKRLHTALVNAEKTIHPVLDKLRDNVLYLKHNLNARAVSSLKGELTTVNRDVSTLIAAMDKAIQESNAFIKQLKNN